LNVSREKNTRIRRVRARHGAIHRQGSVDARICEHNAVDWEEEYKNATSGVSGGKSEDEEQEGEGEQEEAQDCEVEAGGIGGGFEMVRIWRTDSGKCRWATHVDDKSRSVTSRCSGVLQLQHSGRGHSVIVLGMGSHLDHGSVQFSASVALSICRYLEGSCFGCQSQNATTTSYTTGPGFVPRGV